MKRKGGPEEVIVLKRVKRSNDNTIPIHPDANFHIWTIVRPYVIRQLILDQIAIENRLNENERQYADFNLFVHDQEHCLHDRLDFQSRKKYHSLWYQHCLLSEKIYGHIWLVVNEIQPFDLPRSQGKIYDAWLLLFHLDGHIKTLGVEK